MVRRPLELNKLSVYRSTMEQLLKSDALYGGFGLSAIDANTMGQSPTGIKVAKLSADDFRFRLENGYHVVQLRWVNHGRPVGGARYKESRNVEKLMFYFPAYEHSAGGDPRTQSTVIRINLNF